MSVSFLTDGDVAERAAAPSRAAATPFARWEVFASVEAAEPVWQALWPQAVATPYQLLEWIAAWCRHVSPEIGETPFLVAAYDTAGRPAALLPFGVRRHGPARIARWLGGTQANYHFGPFREDLVGAASPQALRTLLRGAGRQAGVDAYLLMQQPFAWRGLENPFARLPWMPSVERGYRTDLAADPAAWVAEHVSASRRRNHRKKERGLAEHGPVRTFRATTPDEITRLIDAYQAQKAAWFTERGIHNVFADPGIDAFLREAAALRPGAEPGIELYGLAAGDEIVAVLAGAVARGRFCLMMISMRTEGFSRYSPGELLLLHTIEDCCARGLAQIDLGVGDLDYKKSFCPDEELLFDTALPVTLLGRGVAASWTGMRELRRRAKQSPAVKDALARLRRLRAGRTAETKAVLAADE